MNEEIYTLHAIILSMSILEVLLCAAVYHIEHEVLIRCDTVLGSTERSL
jgi:hypothetical protein